MRRVPSGQSKYLRVEFELEAEAESYDLGRQDLNDEFAELESSEQVEEELAALKARMRPADKPSD